MDYFHPRDMTLKPTNPMFTEDYGFRSQPPPAASVSSGSIDPALFRAIMKMSGQGQERPSPLQALGGQQDPRAAAAAQMQGTGMGSIQFAQKPPLIPKDIMDIASIAAKIYGAG